MHAYSHCCMHFYAQHVCCISFTHAHMHHKGMHNCMYTNATGRGLDWVPSFYKQGFGLGDLVGTFKIGGSVKSAFPPSGTNFVRAYNVQKKAATGSTRQIFPMMLCFRWNLGLVKKGEQPNHMLDFGTIDRKDSEFLSLPLLAITYFLFFLRGGGLTSEQQIYFHIETLSNWPIFAIFFLSLVALQ